MKRASVAALVALVVVLVAAAVGLSLQTAATTINYPPYSSFDNEEQGLRAYYETARRLAIPVERNYQSLAKLTGTKGTVIYADVAPGDLRYADTKELERYEKLADGGARLILLMNEQEEFYQLLRDKEKVEKAPKPADTKAQPSKTQKPLDKNPEKKSDKKEPDGSGPAGAPPATAKKERDENLRLRWGVELAPVDVPRKKKGIAYDDTQGQFVARTWNFAKWDEKWKPVAAADSRVFSLERHYGSGSIVILLGLESFTNKTLLTKVDSGRIANTLSGPRPLIFDEAHLGVADDNTVAGYARQRHLEWLLLGLAVLAGLYVWRSSVSFVPALPEIRGADIIGRDAHTALTSLLSQSIKRPDLPREMIAAWRASFRMLPSSKIHVTDESLETFAATSDSAAPAGYVAISQSHAANRRPSNV